MSPSPKKKRLNPKREKEGEIGDASPSARRLLLPHAARGGPRVGESIGVLGGEGGLLLALPPPASWTLRKPSGVSAQ